MLSARIGGQPSENMGKLVVHRRFAGPLFFRRPWCLCLDQACQPLDLPSRTHLRERPRANPIMRCRGGCCERAWVPPQGVFQNPSWHCLNLRGTSRVFLLHHASAMAVPLLEAGPLWVLQIGVREAGIICFGCLFCHLKLSSTCFIRTCRG